MHHLLVIHPNRDVIHMRLLLVLGWALQEEVILNRLILAVAPLNAPSGDSAQGVRACDPRCRTRFKREQIGLRYGQIFFLGFL